MFKTLLKQNYLKQVFTFTFTFTNNFYFNFCFISLHSKQKYISFYFFSLSINTYLHITKLNMPRTHHENSCVCTIELNLN